MKVRDQAVGGGFYRCIKKVEPRTLQRRKRLLELRVVGALGPKLLPRLGKVGLAGLQHRPCAFQRGAGGIGFGNGVDAPFDKFENTLGLGLNVLEFGGLLDDPRLRRLHGGRGGSQRLTDLLDLSLGFSHGNLEGARINAEQDLPGLDTSIVGDLDAYDASRDFGRHADNIRLYDRLR